MYTTNDEKMYECERFKVKENPGEDVFEWLMDNRFAFRSQKYVFHIHCTVSAQAWNEFIVHFYVLFHINFISSLFFFSLLVSCFEFGRVDRHLMYMNLNSSFYIYFDCVFRFAICFDCVCVFLSSTVHPFIICESDVLCLVFIAVNKLTTRTKRRYFFTFEWIMKLKQFWFNNKIQRHLIGIFAQFN